MVDNVIVRLEGQSLSEAQVTEVYNDTKPVKTSPAKPDTESMGMVSWGTDNLFPQNAIKRIKELPGLSSGMNFLTNAFGSFRLRYGRLTGYQENGDPIYDRTMIPEVENFLRVNNPTLYFTDFASEAFRLWNPFVTLYKTLSGKAIGRIVVERSKDVRLAKMQPNGVIPEVYINANWDDGATKGSQTTITRKLMDRYLDWAEYLKGTSASDVCMQLHMPETGDDYYQTPPWYSFVESGWHDIATSIPKIKKAFLKNLTSPAWLLYIPQTYFENKYPEWKQSNTTPEAKRKIIQSEVEDWKRAMMGPDNSGKVWANIYTVDAQGKEYGKWEVKKLEASMDGQFLEDSYESYLMLYRSLGFDGQLIGSIPAKSGQGNSGGSDKREGTNVLMTWLQPIAAVALQPFEVARDFNGWDPFLRFWVDVPFMPSKNEISTKDRTPTSATN